MPEIAPATLEGWYALHQMFALDWSALGALEDGARQELVAEAAALLATPDGEGWSASYQLVGGGADIMVVHFRESLDAVGQAELRWRRSRLGAFMDLTYDFTSVTEAGLYGATAEAAEAGPHGSEAFEKVIREQMEAERASRHVRTRLYPDVPADYRYVCFYPMNKRRVHPDNWYGLPVAERNLLMREHGLSARRFAGRVFQIITGAMGFDDWEWGVTLYAADPLEFKRIVTELRYDEASARYGEFGQFFTGYALPPEHWEGFLTAG